MIFWITIPGPQLSRYRLSADTGKCIARCDASSRVRGVDQRLMGGYEGKHARIIPKKLAALYPNA